MASQASTSASVSMRASSSTSRTSAHDRRCCVRRRSRRVAHMRRGTQLLERVAAANACRFLGIQRRSLAAGLRRPPPIPRHAWGLDMYRVLAQIENRSQPAHRRRRGSRKQHAALRGHGRWDAADYRCQAEPSRALRARRGSRDVRERGRADREDRALSGRRVRTRSDRTSWTGSNAPRAHVRSSDDASSSPFSLATCDELRAPFDEVVRRARSQKRRQKVPLRARRSGRRGARTVRGKRSQSRTPSRRTTAYTPRIVLLNEYLSPERFEFYEELATIFAPLAPRRLIDVGCGTGHLLRLTVDRMAVAPERVVGVDHSEAGIRRARELLPAATWVVADLYSIPVEERFDLVLCTEVLEHLHEPSARGRTTTRIVCTRRSCRHHCSRRRRGFMGGARQLLG